MVGEPFTSLWVYSRAVVSSTPSIRQRVLIEDIPREEAIMKDLSSLYVATFGVVFLAYVLKNLPRFSTSIHWLSFLNKEHFFRKVIDVSEREKLQPSLVLSALALATLLQSSELGLGHDGRVRALWLRDSAQSYLEASWAASAIDSSLAQAAMVRES